MIIVSQDKEEIVNFNMVESIWICSDEEGRFTIEATADTNSTLGYYKTKERAKEVLREIIDEYIKYATIENKLGSVKEVTILPKKYEMPEE